MLPSQDMRMPVRPPAKLGARQAFLRVQGGGRRFAGRHMVLMVAPGADVARLGFTVSRRVGNAVVRNRVRRRLRELLRLQPQLLLPAHDHVVVAFARASGASSNTLRCELQALSGRAQAWLRAKKT